MHQETCADAILDVLLVCLPQIETPRLISTLTFVTMFWGEHNYQSPMSFLLVSLASALSKLSEVDKEHFGEQFIVVV